MAGRVREGGADGDMKQNFIPDSRPPHPPTRSFELDPHSSRVCSMSCPHQVPMSE
jgi:hypothetical protein